MATSQNVSAMKDECTRMPVLQQGSAYYNIRRDMLFEIWRRHLLLCRSDMILQLLGTLEIETINDRAITKGNIDKGFTKGLPRGPSLLNALYGKRKEKCEAYRARTGCLLCQIT